MSVVTYLAITVPANKSDAEITDVLWTSWAESQEIITIEDLHYCPRAGLLFVLPYMRPAHAFTEAELAALRESVQSVVGVA
jgi:hypothetical protein